MVRVTSGVRKDKKIDLSSNQNRYTEELIIIGYLESEVLLHDTTAFILYLAHLTYRRRRPKYLEGAIPWLSSGPPGMM